MNFKRVYVQCIGISFAEINTIKKKTRALECSLGLTGREPCMRCTPKGGNYIERVSDVFWVSKRPLHAMQFDPVVMDKKRSTFHFVRKLRGAQFSHVYSAYVVWTCNRRRRSNAPDRAINEKYEASETPSLGRFHFGAV